MRSKFEWVVGLAHRSAYATAIASVVWVLSVVPLNLSSRGLASRVIRILDLPIATASQLLPCNESGVDLWYHIGPGSSSCPNNPGQEFFSNHMRVGVPAYVLLFYSTAIYRSVRNRWLRRS